MNPGVCIKQAEAILAFARAERILGRARSLVFAPWSGIVDYRFAHRLLDQRERAALLVSRIRAADAADDARYAS